MTTFTDLLAEVLEGRSSQFTHDPLDLKNYGPPQPLCPLAAAEQHRHKLMAHELIARRRSLEAQITCLNEEMEAEHYRWIQTLSMLQPEIAKAETLGHQVRISDDSLSFHISLSQETKDGNLH